MTPFDRISAFVLEHAADVPLRQRAELYHDLAALTTDEFRGLKLLQLARDCQAIEERSGQLLLGIRSREDDAGPAAQAKN